MADPQLPAGIGTDQEVDQTNQFIRAQPWYQQWLQSIGQGGSGVSLQGGQKDELLNMARQHGIGISHDFEMDDHGNLRKKGHKLRNTLIAAGIGAGAAFGGPAILGALSGAGAPAAGAATGVAAGAGGAAGVLPSTIIGSGFLPGIAGGVGMAGGAASGVAGAAGAAGIGGKILSAASRLSPILSGAAQSESASNALQGKQAMDRYKTQLDAPTTRLAQSRDASVVKNWTPVHSTFNGQGSGVHGDSVSVTGGYMNPNLYDSNTKAMADDITHQNLLAQLQHGADVPDVGTKDSMGDKILGGAALGTGILGALKGMRF